jgi:hypothetical protein
MISKKKAATISRNARTRGKPKPRRTAMPNPAPDTGPADRDPEKYRTRGPTTRNPNPNQVSDSEGSAAPAKRPTAEAVVTEWLRGNSSIRATDDSDFKNSAQDLLATLDNAGLGVSQKGEA